MKMSVTVYVNKNHKKSINDIFLLIRKGDGINDRYENCYENHPSKRELNRKSSRVIG